MAGVMMPLSLIARLARTARVRAAWLAATTLAGACVTLLAAACTFTPWQTLGRPGDEGRAQADQSTASGENAAASAAGASVTPVSTPIAAPASKVVAEVPAAGVPAAGAAKDLYRVKAGDTLYHIAAAHGQRPADIVAWNKLPASGQVNVGQMLRVAPPVKAAVATPAPSAPAATPAASAKAPAAHAASVAAASEATAAPPAARPRATTARLAWPMNGSVATAFSPGKSRGIVIAGAPGEPVKAAAAGRVVYAGSGIQGYGKLIIVKHNARLLTAYGRNGRLLVKQGDAVKLGQTIATSGADSAGVGTLLFEVRSNGKPVDPQEWLPRSQS